MVTSRGRSEAQAFIGSLPAQIEAKLLRGAARKAATVIADEARDRTQSSEVRAAIKVATAKGEGRIIGKVQVKGPGAHLAPWEEYGTAPHFISVDDSQRSGRSIGRINQQVRDAGGDHSLVIGGNFVGTTVLHPGAQPHPFLRPALDIKAAAAIAAAQAYINARVSKLGIVGSGDVGDDGS